VIKYSVDAVYKRHPANDNALINAIFHKLRCCHRVNKITTIAPRFIHRRNKIYFHVDL